MLKINWTHSLKLATLCDQPIKVKYSLTGSFIHWLRFDETFYHYVYKPMNTIQLPFVADRCLGRFEAVSDERRLQAELTNSLSSSMDCRLKSFFWLFGRQIVAYGCHLLKRYSVALVCVHRETPHDREKREQFVANWSSVNDLYFLM